MAQSEIRTWIDGLEEFGIKPGLERTRRALELLGNPDSQFKSVLVTGTNGKGSTCSFLSHILQANGYKTGFYSSPNLMDVTERFRINQKPVGNALFEKTAFELREIDLSNHLELTHFEFLTVVGLQLFAKQKVDWAVLEIGMGGALDSTNVVKAEASVITNVGMDHQKWLGNTKREIAIQKAGIIKKQKPFLTSETDPNLKKLFSELAESEQAPFFLEGTQFQVAPKKIELGNTVFDFSGLELEWKDVTAKLSGEHQVHNAGLALATMAVLRDKNGLRLNEEKTRKAIEKTAWTGRFQVLSQTPLVIVDCAHNPAGMQSLAHALQTVLPATKFRVLMGISQDRPLGQMIEPIGPLASEMIFSQAKYKGVSAIELQAASAPFVPKFKTKVVTTLKDAVGLALQNPKSNEPLLICGSIYLVGEALQTTALKKLLAKKIKE